MDYNYSCVGAKNPGHIKRSKSTKWELYAIEGVKTEDLKYVRVIISFTDK